MDILVTPLDAPGAGVLSFAGERLRCALGRGGVSAHKREGDGTTPAGCFHLRGLFYRADRLEAPATRLPVRALEPADGWCDDPAHDDYNHSVRLPHSGRVERLWREDEAYDVVVVLGYNDDPVTPGRGSAVFLHVAKPGYPPTEGCVALALEDLLKVVRAAGTETRLCVAERPAGPVTD